MDVSRRPRRSKTSRMPLHDAPGKINVQPSSSTSSSIIRSDAVSPRRASSILKGSVKLLASGRLGQNGGNSQYDDSVAEVTVSLSRSSFLSYHSAGRNNHYHSNATCRRGDDEEDGASQETANNSYAQFLDTFQSPPPLGIAPRPSSTGEGDDHHFHLDDDDDDDGDNDGDESSPRQRYFGKKKSSGEHAGIEEPLDDFMTAYTSPEEPALEFDDLISAKPLKFTKAKVRILRPSSESPESKERLHRSRQEQSYWNNVVNNRSMTLGMLHRQTAEAFLSLGHAHMRVNDYSEAMSAFQSSCKIFKALDGPTHLSVGRALDAFGLAALRSCKQGGAPYLMQAKTALEEAFAIRFHSLGLWHVDTVETFNKIASVYLHMGNLGEASKAYKEVYLVRKAIYGINHPSVAISAHGLANVYLKLKQPDESLRYFQVALDIYRSMYLPKNHPTVARLLNDRKRLRQQFRGHFQK